MEERRVEKAHEIQLQLKLSNVMAIRVEKASRIWGDCSSDISVLNRVTRRVEIPNIQLNIWYSKQHKMEMDVNLKV